MSARLFKSFNNDSSSDYLQKKCIEENLRLYQYNKFGIIVDNSSNPCYKIGLCNTTTIKDYNILQKYETYYNYNRYDSSGNIKVNFNGQMNHSSYLSSDISSSVCLVKQLDPSLNDLSCNYIALYEYGSTNANNLLQIDMSGLVFNFDTCSKWLSN